MALKLDPYRLSMPVTMPRTVTLSPLQAEFAPSVWMLVIGVSVPAGLHGPLAGGAHAVPQFSGAKACGPVKSFALLSVSGAALRMKASLPFVVGNARPTPSRHGCAVCPTESM